MTLDNYYLDKICNIPYKEWDYDMPNKIIYEYIRRYRKELSLDDLISFFKEDPDVPKYIYHRKKISIDSKIELIVNVFYNDFNFELSEERIIELHEILRGKESNINFTMRNFIDIINFISNDKELFSGVDSKQLDWNSKLEDLFNLRSYKISSLL